VAIYIRILMEVIVPYLTIVKLNFACITMLIQVKKECSKYNGDGKVIRNYGELWISNETAMNCLKKY
jgi:hypothetical protein